MTDPQKLIAHFQRTHWIIKEQTKGLTHADTLLTLPFRANTMNWILGHIADGRNGILKTLGELPALDEAQASRYERDSEPVASAEGAVPLETLLTAIDESQTRIVTALEKATMADLDAIYNEKHQFSVGDRLAFLHWHETYHLGQLEILRQLAGTDDKII